MFTDLMMSTTFDDVFKRFDELMNSERLDFSQVFPPMNIFYHADNKAVEIEMALAGYKKDELNIEVEENRIVISFDTSDFFKDAQELAGVMVDDYFFKYDDVEGKSYLYIPIGRFGFENMSEIMDLTDAQKDILRIIYNVAEGENLEFDDLPDIKTALDYSIKNASTLAPKYGRINLLGKATFIKAIDEFSKKPESNLFKECEFDVDALFDIDSDDGITIIRCHDLSFNAPLFKRCILWILREINYIFEDESKEANLFVLIEKAHAVFAGLDKEFDDKMKDVLNSLADKGIKVCLTAHYITEIPEELAADMECVSDVYAYLTENGVETVKDAPGYEYDMEGMIAKIKAESAEHDRLLAEQRANKKKKKKKKSKRAQMLEKLQNGQDISASKEEGEEEDADAEAESEASENE